MKALESVRSRLRAMDPFRFDVALAALFVAAGVVELALIDPEGHSRWLTIAAGVLSLSSVALRRRNPVLAAALFLLPAITQAAVGGYLTTITTTPFVAIMFLLFSIGRYASGRRFAVATALLSVGMTLTLFLEAASSQMRSSGPSSCSACRSWRAVRSAAAR